jgi:PAS domain-containing protein
MDNDLTRVVGALPGLSTDIQERKHTEPEGRVRELSLQLVVDCIPGLVAVTKPNGEMEYANAELLAALESALGRE